MLLPRLGGERNLALLEYWLSSILQETQCAFWVQKPHKLGMAPLHGRGRGEGGGPHSELMHPAWRVSQGSSLCPAGRCPTLPQP